MTGGGHGGMQQTLHTTSRYTIVPAPLSTLLFTTDYEYCCQSAGIAMISDYLFVQRNVQRLRRGLSSLGGIYCLYNSCGSPTESLRL